MKFGANKNINAVLCLADGKYFFGQGIGKKGKTIGEICFNTAITGYQEILTDPSYHGQIITFTFPHIGNVGCNSDDEEAAKVFASGLVVRGDITEDSNFRSEKNLNSWLIKKGLTGICSVDTRALTCHIRNNGAKNAIIAFVPEGREIDTAKLIAEIKNLPDLDGAELCSKVSTNKSYKWKSKTISLAIPLAQTEKEKFDHGYSVVVMDYGVKENILNCLVDHGFQITVLPAKSSFEQITKHKPDGVFLSNGPGDPFATSKYAVPVIRKLLAEKIPIFGICMGHQLLAIAAGLTTVKMFQGHRGANHPVKNLQSGMVEITSQNHGFCVSSEKKSNHIEITHISLFDNTIEGIRLKNAPAFSVQYHPESSPGPHDSRYLFKQFIELIKNAKAQS